MDSDALIKLTKAGAKEAVAAAMELWIPPTVQREAVEEGRRMGQRDALQIEANIATKRVHVVVLRKRIASPEVALFSGGEQEVVSAFRRGGFDAIVSDDQRVLSRLEGLQVPFLTPGAVLVMLALRRRIEARQATAFLEALRPWISPDEYALCSLALEEVTARENKSS